MRLRGWRLSAVKHINWRVDIMLGEKTGEYSSKITGQRVLEVNGGNPTVETSFQATERILGVEATTIAPICLLRGRMGVSMEKGRARGNGQQRGDGYLGWTGSGKVYRRRWH
jgi:hypothetical protein